MTPLHRLHICLLVHNYRVPPTSPTTYIRVRAVVWECSEGQTDTQMAVKNIHFASATPHAKYNTLERERVYLPQNTKNIENHSKLTIKHLNLNKIKAKLFQTLWIYR